MASDRRHHACLARTRRERSTTCLKIQSIEVMKGTKTSTPPRTLLSPGPTEVSRPKRTFCLSCALISALRESSAANEEGSLQRTLCLVLIMMIIRALTYARWKGGEGVGSSRLQGHHRVQAPQVTRAGGSVLDPEPARPQGVLRDHLRSERQVAQRSAPRLIACLFVVCVGMYVRSGDYDRNKLFSL
jgi:hypothetical protein